MNEDNETGLIKDIFTNNEKCLTDEEKQRLHEQDKRLVSDFKAKELELQAQRNWDLFYKRNETRFFKDRRWTTREFTELLCDTDSGTTTNSKKRYMLEVGCGVGNLIYPLIEDKTLANKFFYYACDFSPRAIEFVRTNSLYDENCMKAFQCDITTEELLDTIPKSSLDIITMVFVLSAINPKKFPIVVKNLRELLKPNGIVLFRD
ncbi:tRNA N(3)-methylcytidine methyltransferase METTL6-like, partial [Teleopsis dalmanni]